MSNEAVELLLFWNQVAIAILAVVLWFVVAYCWHLRNAIMLLGEWCNELSERK